MAKVLFQCTDRNTQVDGLPYVDSYPYVKAIVLEGVPSEGQIADILRSGDESTLVTPIPRKLLAGYRTYAPTTYNRVTSNMPPGMAKRLFGKDRSNVSDEDKLLLQLQTEIEAKGATTDAAIINTRRDLGTVVNKAHILNRLYTIGRIYGHLPQRDYPMLFGDLRDESTWDEALSDMKLTFIDFLREVPSNGAYLDMVIRKQEVTDKELREYFVFVEWLKEKLGNNLLGILCYGSASRAFNDPSKFSDYDNQVRVRNVKKAHRALAGTLPYVLNGRVYEGEHENIEGAKHVGIHLFPSDENYAMRHSRFLHDLDEFLLNTKVLYGEFPFPVPNRKSSESVERGISQAYTKLRCIAASLNWAANTPEKLLGRKHLFEFIVKNIRFFYQHSLNATQGHIFRDKHTLNAMLAKRNIKIPEYEHDLEHITDSLIYATRVAFELQEELFDKHSPDLSFVSVPPSERRNYDWDLLTWEQVLAERQEPIL